MNDYKVIEIKRSVFESNDREADKVRQQLKANHRRIKGRIQNRRYGG